MQGAALAAELLEKAGVPIAPVDQAPPFRVWFAEYSAEEVEQIAAQAERAHHGIEPGDTGELANGT